MSIILVPLVALTTALVVAPALAAAPAQAQAAELHAIIHASGAHPSARGDASYEVDHGVRELEVHLRGVPELAGHRLVVRVHGARMGTVTVSAAGTAHLDRHRGVGACAAGDRVRVRTAGGTLVGGGTLHRHHDVDD